MKKLSIAAALLFAFGTVTFAQDATKQAAPAKKAETKKTDKKAETKKADKKAETKKADKKAETKASDKK